MILLCVVLLCGSDSVRARGKKGAGSRLLRKPPEGRSFFSDIFRFI